MISDELETFLTEAWQRTIDDWKTGIRKATLYERQCDECGLTVTFAFIPKVTSSPVGDRAFCKSCQLVTTWEYDELRRA